jgi:hypothetical protein
MSDTIRMVSGPDAYQPRKGLANFTTEYTKWVDVFTKQEVGDMLLQAMSAKDPELRSQWLAYAKEWSMSRE